MYRHKTKLAVMKICSETPEFVCVFLVILHKHTISTILKHKDLHRTQFMRKFCKCDVKEIGVLLLPVGFVLKWTIIINTLLIYTDFLHCLLQGSKWYKIATTKKQTKQKYTKKTNKNPNNNQTNQPKNKPVIQNKHLAQNQDMSSWELKEREEDIAWIIVNKYAQLHMHASEHSHYLSNSKEE